MASLRNEARLIVKRYNDGKFTRFMPCGPKKKPYSAVKFKTSLKTGAPEETVNKLKSKGFDCSKKTKTPRMNKKTCPSPSADNNTGLMHETENLINSLHEVNENPIDDAETESKTTHLLPSSDDDTVLMDWTNSLFDDDDQPEDKLGNGKVSVSTQTQDTATDEVYEAIVIVTADAEVQTESNDDNNNSSLHSEGVQLLIDFHESSNNRKGSEPKRNFGACLPLGLKFFTKSRFSKETKCKVNKRTRS
jgi:hypothetical protein